MEFRLLGPLEVRTDRGTVEVRGRRQRAVLAALALRANQVVTVSHLLAAAWDDPPPSAEANIRTHVMTLRRLLEAAGEQDRRVQTRPHGYLLRAEPDEVDVIAFEAMAAQGERAMAEGATAAAVEHFDRACRLWRGQALDGIPPSQALRLEAQRLDERRLIVVERSAQARLDLGRHAGLVDELTRVGSAYPLRESLWEYLMLALYRSGRQADALAAYDRVEKTLADELGIDPNPRLQRLRLQILRADPALQPPSPPVPSPPQPPPQSRSQPPSPPPASESPAPAPSRTVTASGPVPQQLPPTVPAFTGRTDERARLGSLTSDSGTAREDEAVVIFAISGSAGVGKTALAIHFAHQVAGRYADGQLYMNLRGYDPQQPPLPPGEVLGQFLRALGVDPRAIPTDQDEQAALYRSVVAGKRLLVVLDNAVDPEQVRPLLPGSATCLVIVTSRSRLPGLVARDGARPITLDVLSPAEATELLARVIGTERIVAEPAAAAELTRLCGCLPLALRIAAVRIAGHRHLTLADLVGELAAEQRRLDVLTAGDDEATAVRAALGWTYRSLSATAARLLCLLGLHPGPHVSVPGVAALAGVTTPRAHGLLDTLASVHLLEETTRDRYRMHDLVRLYARERADIDVAKEEREVAVRRLLSWYLHTADAADRVIMPHRRRPFLDRYDDDFPPLAFEGIDQAVRWCETERLTMVAAARLAVEVGDTGTAWKLPVALMSFFILRKHWDDWIGTHQRGLLAARDAEDQYGQCWILGSLGYAYGDLNQFDAALDCFQQTLALSQVTDDRWGQAVALAGLGLTHRGLRRYEQARDFLTEALTIYRDLGDPWGQALALTGLGFAHGDLHDLDRAVDCFDQALILHRDLDYLWGQAWVLHGFADTYQSRHRHDRAINYLRQALTIYRDLGDPWGQAFTLHNLARAQRDSGDSAAAGRSWRQATALLDHLDHPQAAEIRSQAGTFSAMKPAAFGS